MLFSGGLRLRRLRLVGIWLSLVGRIRVAMRRGMEGWSQRPGGSAQLERAIPVPSNILDPWTTYLRYPVDGTRMTALAFPIDQLLALE